MSIVARLALCVCLLSYAAPSSAQDNAAACGTSQSVYFGNGVWVVSVANATASLWDLRDELRPSMTTNGYLATNFSLAYNRSVSRFSDVIETARQILGEDYAVFLIGHILGLSDLVEFLLPADLQAQLNDLFRSEAARRLIQGNASAADVAVMVGSYRADIIEGRRIALVSHSQGNLFGNLAFSQLTAAERASFAIVPVASPASTVARSLVGHVTFLNDLVIDLVQVLRLAAGFPSALLPNDFAESPHSFTAHEFSENYLTDASADAFIVNGVLNTLNQLPFPSAVANEGIITVTLTWGAQPDVDLHVFEPSGPHVYYANLRGAVGFLDVDDVTSFGPEHYYASCANLTAASGVGVGTYRVGVNYFRGLSPETARIVIKVPGAEQTFTQNLPAQRGSAGDAVPVPVASIVVTKDPVSGILRFAIGQ